MSKKKQTISGCHSNCWNRFDNFKSDQNIFWIIIISFGISRCGSGDDTPSSIKFKFIVYSNWKAFPPPPEQKIYPQTPPGESYGYPYNNRIFTKSKYILNFKGEIYPDVKRIKRKNTWNLNFESRILNLKFRISNLEWGYWAF